MKLCGVWKKFTTSCSEYLYVVVYGGGYKLAKQKNNPLMPFYTSRGPLIRVKEGAKGYVHILRTGYRHEGGRRKGQIS